MKKLIGKVLEYIARLTGNYDLRRLAWDLQRNPRMGYEVARRQQIASGYSRAVASRKQAIASIAGKLGFSEYNPGGTEQRTSSETHRERDLSAYERIITSTQKEIDDMNKLYTQRQRWQIGELEVFKMFYGKKNMRSTVRY